MQKNLCSWELLKTPIVGKPPWPCDPPPPSRRGHQEQNVQPERSSDPRPVFRRTRSRFRSVDCACHIPTQNPRPSMRSQIPSSDFWPTSPPVWQSRLQCSTLPALQKKNIALWGYPETPNEDQPARHSAVPQIYRLIWALMPFLTQPEPRPPGPTQTAGRTLSTSDPPWP